MDQVQQFVNQNFPKTLGMVAKQAGTPGAEPVTRDEFKLLERYNANPFIQQDRAKSKISLASVGDAVGHAVKGFANGVMELWETAGRTAFPFADWDPQSATWKEGYQSLKVSGAKIAEGFAQGNENLHNAGAMAGVYALSKVGLADDYDRYELLRKIEKQQIERQQGIPSVLSEQFSKENPEVMPAASNIGNVLDGTLLVPGVGPLLKSGVGITRTGLGIGMRAGGAMLEAPLKATSSAFSLIKNAVGEAPLKTGAAGAAIAALANDDSGVSIKGLGAGALALGSSALAGKFLKHAGVLIGSEQAASKLLAEGLAKETGPLSRLTLNALSQVPDGVVRAARMAVDGGLDAATIGGGLGYIRASSDPFNTDYDIARETVASTVGAGVIGLGLGSIAGTAKELSGAGYKEAYLREIGDNIGSRPEEKSFTADGVEFNVADEKANRLKVAAAEDLSVREKMSLMGILDSAELTGRNVVFVNDATKIPESLGGSGDKMGAGVAVVGGAENPTILINADRINTQKAIEEVLHTTISDAQATSILGEMVKHYGSADQAIESMRPFAEAYIKQTRQNDPARADKLASDLASGMNQNLPVNERLSSLTQLTHEYIAQGIAEKLSTARPEQLIAGRGKSVISNLVDKAVVGVFSAIEMPASGASRDPLTGHFYKDGKLVLDPVLAKTADNVLQNLKNSELESTPAGKIPEMLPGDIAGDGSHVITGPQVTQANAPRRYEDFWHNPKTGEVEPTNGYRKEKIHEASFNKLVESGMPTTVVNPTDAANGIYSGNIKKGEIIYHPNGISTEQLALLFAHESNGQRVIPESSRLPLEQWNQASRDGHLVQIAADVAASKTTGGDRKYFTRNGFTVLPLGFQISKTGGPVLPYFNLTLMHDISNYQRGLSKKINKALSEFGINKTEDWAPLVKRYLENYSDAVAHPAANAIAEIAPKGASIESAKVIRDLIHLSGSGPRKGEERINRPTITLKDMPETTLHPAVDIYGKSVGDVALARDRNAFSHIRADALRDVALFQPSGVPVSIGFDKSRGMPLVRANFSPGKNLRRSRVGNSEVFDDLEYGSRMIVNESGETTLFQENEKPQRFRSKEDAITKSNTKLAKKIAKRPHAKPTMFTDKEKQKIASKLMYGDILGSSTLKEIEAIREGIRLANRSPEDMPYWVELREFDAAQKKQVQTEMRKRRAERQKITQASEAFWKEGKPGTISPDELFTKEPTPKKIERASVPQSVLESAAAAEVPSKPKLSITEITPQQKKQETTFKSLGDISIYIPEKPQQQPVKPRPEAVNLISEPPSSTYRYTVGMQKIDSGILKSKSEFLSKLATWEAEAKERLSKMKPEQAAQVKAEQSAKVEDVVTKVESMPDKEPEPAKSGSSEMPETEIPNVATAVDDARVPRDYAIRKSWGRKFSVWTIGVSSVEGVADSYREALMLAQKKRLQKLKSK